MDIDTKVIAWFRQSMKSPYPQSEWVYADEGRIYIRHIPYSEHKRLILANIEIYEQGQGTFKHLLPQVESLAEETGYLLIMECVHNTRLFDYLTRRGYVSQEFGDPHTLCMA